MGGFTKPNGFMITNPRSNTLQQKFLKIQKLNNLGSTTKEKNQEITYLLELPTKGMMTLIMPLLRDRTATRVTTPDVVGQKPMK